MVAKYYDEVIIPDVDGNREGPKMYLCATFGWSTPDGVGVFSV